MSYLKAIPSKKINKSNKKIEAIPMQKPHKMRTSGCHKLTKGEKGKLLNGFTDHLHPHLLDFIRCDWINAQPSEELNLKNPQQVHFSQFQQSVLLDEFMDRMSGKYITFDCFIERTTSSYFWLGHREV